MVKNYLKIAYRNLVRYKAYTTINVVGLTLGLTCSSLLFLFLQNELSYDSFHSKAHNIARVVEVDNSGERTRYFARTSMLTGPAMSDYFPEVINQTSLTQIFGHIDIHWNGERIQERSWGMADSTFFQIFDFTFLEGNQGYALTEPNSIVLSESTAKKFFGDQSALNQLMEFSGFTVKVTGVIEDMPVNSQIQLNMILSKSPEFEQLPFWERLSTSWDRLFAFTYVELAEETSIASVNKRSREFIDTHRGENGADADFILQPLTDVYLNSENVEGDIFDKKGSWFTIYLFSAISLFILTIASINYINLATARSMERAKEIGIRKVSGALRGQLIYQFLSESMLVSVISVVFSIGLIDLILPYFNTIADVSLSIDIITLPYLTSLLGLAILVGLISGLYPAFYLSRLKPSESLKGDKATGDSSARLRKALVILQFSLSIIMIITTLTVSRQLDYVKKADLGFDKDQMLVIDINNQRVREGFEAVKTEFSKISGVKAVASSSRVPGEWKNIREAYVKKARGGDSIQSYFMCFDENVVNTYSLKVKEGRDFLGKLAEDSTAVLLNESAARALGNVRVGENLSVARSPYPLRVVGILEDFNFQSLHSEIAPLMVGYWYNPITVIDYFSLNIESGANLISVVEAAKNVHETFDNSTPMEFHFLNEQVDAFYKSEEQAGDIFTLAASITILIACLGLFGLASFVVRKRAKEVSIRKVLGASSFQLFLLLSKTFAVQVLISSLVAAPIAWWVMDRWLSNFSYRVSLPFWIFLIGGAIALIIALMTTSYQSLKTAFSNPANTLKNE
ncbi:MAG: ABC transporter permease [Bacteroidota bacterium]